MVVLLIIYKYNQIRYLTKM